MARNAIKGVTMVELVMAIAVTSIVVAVGTVSYVDYRNDARIAVTIKKLQEFRLALRGDPTLVSQGKYTRPGFIVDVGEIPSDLGLLVENDGYEVYSQTEQRGWRGPYLNPTADFNLDGWGNALEINSTTGNVRSAGKDGAFDTDDDLNSDSEESGEESSGSSSS